MVTLIRGARRKVFKFLKQTWAVSSQKMLYEQKAEVVKPDLQKYTLVWMKMYRVKNPQRERRDKIRIVFVARCMHRLQSARSVA